MQASPFYATKAELGGSSQGQACVVSSLTLASSASDLTSLDRRFSMPEFGTPPGSQQSANPSLLLPSQPESIAAGVKSRRGRMPARALFTSRKGRMRRQSYPLAGHQPLTSEGRRYLFEGSAEPFLQGSAQLPKAASVGSHLCLLRDGSREPSKGSFGSSQSSQAALQGFYGGAEDPPDPLDFLQRMRESLSTPDPRSFTSSMCQPPGQIGDLGTDPLLTSSSSQSGSQLSGESTDGVSTWDQVCLWFAAMAPVF